jgi:hypothetical protein
MYLQDLGFLIHLPAGQVLEFVPVAEEEAILRPTHRPPEMLTLLP